MSTTPTALTNAAASFGTAEAVADGGTRLTYGQLLDEVRVGARALIARGVQPGDRVALWAPNTWQWVVAALATHYAGAVLVPINTRYTAAEAHDIISRSGAETLFVAGEFLGKDRHAQLREQFPELTLHTVVRLPDGWTDLAAYARAVAPHDADERAGAVRPDDVADILFTSGTTGRSKGVVSAHRQSLGVAAAWAECATLGAADRYLVINPFFHSFGYKAGILACLLTGATVVPQAVYDVPTAMNLIAAERITVLPGAPTVFQTILDHPARADYELSTLRVAVTGAATVPVALVERMQTELSFDIVLTAFGMTEAVVVTMCRPDDDAATVAHTCGRATAGFELRIGAQDELLLRGPNVMLGYYNDPESTDAAIDSDGWLHTGDIAAVDERGYLRITDRLKDMYICGGFNVYPAEVEQVLARLPAVAESAVVGVPDARLGEVGKAYVVLRPGRHGTADEVIAHAGTALANFKVPRYVEFVAALPRNAAGKVLKRELRDKESA